MGNLSYVPLSADLIEDLDAANITIVTAVAGYPSSKLQNIPMGDTARGTDPGGGIVIKIDFGINVRPKFIGILNHNITSGNVVVYSFNDVHITPSGETLIIPYRELDMKAYKPESWTPKRYFSLYFGGCTFSQAFLEIGKLVAALEIVTFSKGFSPGIPRAFDFKIIHNKTSAGVEYTHILNSGIDYIGFKWDPQLKSPLLDELLTFLRATYGGGYPCLIIPDNDKAEFFYVRNQDRFDWNEEIARSIISQGYMNFEGLSRGRVQVA